MSINSRGFTLIEVLVISPIIILFIGFFLALLVSLTGESLVVREKNAAAYDTQSALDDMEASVNQAISFLPTTGTVPIPQGKDNSTSAGTPFTNETTGETNTLIIRSAATTNRPSDPSRELIYMGAGACDSKNPLYTYYTVYFTALDPDTADTTDRALYRRVILPQNPACKTVWQRGSCNVSRMTSHSSVCKARDEKLVAGVTTFDVQYFIGNSTTAVADNQAATATDAAINLGLSKRVAGSPVEYSGTVRANSLNIQTSQSSDGSVTPPSNPPIQWSRNGTGSTPYRTTFSWSSIGSASSYLFRYRIDGGSWVEQTVAQSGSPSFNVDATARKQAIDVQVDVVTNNGNYAYGSQSASDIPRWNVCTYQNGWADYANGYAGAGYTKTNSGIVGLRGLVRSGGVGTTICTLPVGFRPKFAGEKLIFQAAGYRGGTSSWARVDVQPTGEVTMVSGENPWVSLDGIMFLADSTNYTWTNNTWLNGFSWYGAGHANLRSTTDSIGRVHVQGLGAYSGAWPSTTITNLGAARGVSASTHSPALAGGGPAAVNIATNGAINSRVAPANASWQQMQFIYHPASFSNWSNLPLYNSYQNYGGGWPTAKCYRGPDDVVIMTGLVNRASSGDGLQMSSTTAATPTSCGNYTDGRLLLPAWYAGENSGRLDIQNGAMLPQVTSPTWTSLDGIRFIAD